MDEKKSLSRTSNVALFLSGASLVALTISVPYLCCLIGQIEEELTVSRVGYEKMSKNMWEDLTTEEKYKTRTARQAYKTGGEVVSGVPSGGNEGATTSGAEACPAGAKGAPGMDGMPGMDGTPGTPGKPGAGGVQSDSGVSHIGGCPDCPPGPPGLTGYKGKRGGRGPKGEKGPPGQPGQPGQIGDEGPEGDHGRPGAPGPAGQRGPPGSDAVGFGKGAPGPKGETGMVGVVGDEGLPGERGDDSPPGPQGEMGPAGPPGDTGAEGIPGLPGGAGGQGSDAEYCPCPARKNGETISGVPTPEKYAEKPEGGGAPVPTATESAVPTPGELTSGVAKPDQYDKPVEAHSNVAATDKEVVKSKEAAPETEASGYSRNARLSNAALARKLRRKLVLV